MGKKLDLTGQTFGQLIVIERLANYKKNQTYYKCVCSCGKEVIINSSRLINGKKTSCGCIKENQRKFEDLTGKKFNHLQVLAYSHSKKQPDGRNVYFWKCLCDCGNIAYISSSHLKTGHTTSCGCVLEKHRKNLGKNSYKTGLSKTRIWRIYCNMINRCRNEKISMYKHYGERGITFCEEWEPHKNGFENFCNWSFKNGYSENLTLDRIDVNGNYEPSNCRWVDMYVQANNKRATKFFVYNGEALTISQIARKYNVDKYVLYSRVNKLGWDIEKAVELPVAVGRNQFSKF